MPCWREEDAGSKAEKAGISGTISVCCVWVIAGWCWRDDGIEGKLLRSSGDGPGLGLLLGSVQAGDVAQVKEASLNWKSIITKQDEGDDRVAPPLSSHRHSRMRHQRGGETRRGDGVGVSK